MRNCKCDQYVPAGKVILGGGVAAQKENLTAPLKDLVKDMCSVAVMDILPTS